MRAILSVCSLSVHKTQPLTPRVLLSASWKEGHDVPIQKIISRYEKAILNAQRVAQFADRVYVYDNSIDNENARLLFRSTNGHFAKQYVDTIPEWAETIFDSINK